jgi:sugar phosphate isomerase/epimerase
VLPALSILTFSAKRRSISPVIAHPKLGSRRAFLRDVALLTASTYSLSMGAAEGPTPAKRKMTLCLSPGSIGVSGNQMQIIDLAARYGFESVEPQGEYLAGLSPDKLPDVLASMKDHGLVFGAAGLPVEFRQSEDKFAEGLKNLAPLAAGLNRAGVKRMGTWLMPGHSSLSYVENFHQHARRLRSAAKVLQDQDIRLGMEYVGTRTIWTRQRYPFIHTLKEMRDLMAEIGTPNVGVVLDSWHWWQADDTAADLLSLKNADVVSVDLNDAPSGVAKDQQIDGRRELPCATGVIDVGAFLRALNQIGYDGPVRAEPFNKPLNDLENEPACAATIAALKKAVAQL